jgi:predicted ATPase/class 3 adenylate cyclase
MAELPTGTVTFLFTDIEGSTRLWEQHPQPMRLALARHDACLTAAIESNHGHVFKTVGDAFCAAFTTATDALDAAIAAQQNLRSLQPSAVASAAWLALKVRVALHTGAAEARGGDYFGPALNRIARLLAIAYGGQVLLSGATQELVQDDLPPGASLRELGLHRLRDLQRPEQVYQLLHPDLPTDFPRLRSLGSFHHNLPVQLTSFIGRERELTEVKRLLTTTRLLTLTGSGGCGKTRLTLQVAADLLEEHPDGVWLVELAALADPALVTQTAAAALGVREEAGRPLIETLVDYLKPKALLLVLDNCEHLLSACAQLAEHLLRACPQLRMLATSREGLGIAGELTYRVPSLSLPEPRQLPPVERLMEYEAVRLFAERAVFTEPCFAMREQNAPAVARVCQRLDGIPLAIELAAARLKALPVEQIAVRLDDRFRLLTGGSRTALPRQQTLRAAIDWSYDLLSEPERALLRRLSVFAGGWRLEASEAICAGEGIEDWEVLDLLAALVEKSLVQYEEAGNEARYRLLETIRQYGAEKLTAAGEEAGLRERHRDWYLALAEQAKPELHGPRQGEWLARLEEEHDNLRVALAACIQRGEAEAGLRLGGALWWFWMVRGYLGEGRERLAGALALPGSEGRTAARGRALNGAGALAHHQGDFEGARALYEESLAIFRQLGYQLGISELLNNLGILARYQGDYEGARVLYEESLAIKRQLGHQQGIAASLGNLGIVAFEQGDYEPARAFCEESLAIFRQLGHRQGISQSLNILATVARYQGDYEGAGALYEESLAISRQLGHQWGIAHSLDGLGHVTSDQGDYAAARALYEESLAIFRQLGDQRGIALALDGLAALAAAHQGQPERAARLSGAAEALREAVGAPLSPHERAEYHRHVAATRAALGEEAFAAAWEAGRALSLEQAVAYALDETQEG